MRARGWGHAALAVTAVLVSLTAACGPSGSKAHRPPHVVSLRGRLLRVRDGTLTVRDRGRAGVVRVTFARAKTPIYSVTPTTVAAIQPGSCIATRAEPSARGTVTGRVIVVATSVDDTCPPGSVPEPPPPADPPSPSPSPRSRPASPSPSPSAPPDGLLVSGQVLGVGGRALALEGGDGTPAVVVYPADVQVLFFQPREPSALVIPSCVVVRGARTGRTVAARRIVDWPLHTEC